VTDYSAAYQKAREWDYNADARIGLGVMYRNNAPVWGDSYPVPEPLSLEERAKWVTGFMDERG
jgi:hypothetical protein